MKTVQALYCPVGGEAVNGEAVKGEAGDGVRNETGGVGVGTLVWNNGLSESFSSKPLDLVWQRITACCSTM